MASQLVASRRIAKVPPTVGQRVLRFFVRRRVPITVALLIALGVLDSLVFSGRPRDIFNWRDPFAMTGLVLILAGLLVRAWAAGNLRKQRQLATTGPYACIRHPLYFGSFLIMGGFAALGFDPRSLAIIGPPLLAIYYLAIRNEERHVNKLFPIEWPRYAARVPRLIPRRLVRPRFEEWSFAQWLRNTEYQAWLGAAIGLTVIKVYHMLW